MRVKAIKTVSRLMNLAVARALSKWEYQVAQQQRRERVSTTRCLSQDVCLHMHLAYDFP